MPLALLDISIATIVSVYMSDRGVMDDETVEMARTRKVAVRLIDK